MKKLLQQAANKLVRLLHMRLFTYVYMYVYFYVIGVATCVLSAYISTYIHTYILHKLYVLVRAGFSSPNRQIMQMYK